MNITSNARKRMLTCICAVILIVAMLVTTEASYAASKNLSVTRRQQAGNYWCWAACAQMIGSYKTGSLSAQSTIVRYVKGSAVNEGATDAEVRKAIKYACGKTTYSQSTLSFIGHEDNIDSNLPLVAKMNWNGGGAHVVVVSGYNSSASAKTLRLIDPWGSVATKSYAYSSLVNGTSIGSGTGKYVTTFYTAV
ncbi:MAG: C39 family peptidase [Clostridiales Family XIII bacterium]|nr:C39 family peptidase [Clostridiales Family XIII bacterium]